VLFIRPKEATQKREREKVATKNYKAPAPDKKDTHSSGTFRPYTEYCPSYHNFIRIHEKVKLALDTCEPHFWTLARDPKSDLCAFSNTDLFHLGIIELDTAD
jgi:hypothetical protein